MIPSVARKDSAIELVKSIWAVDCDKIADEVRSRAGKIDFLGVSAGSLFVDILFTLLLKQDKIIASFGKRCIISVFYLVIIQ